MIDWLYRLLGGRNHRYRKLKEAVHDCKEACEKVREQADIAKLHDALDRQRVPPGIQRAGFDDLPH